MKRPNPVVKVFTWPKQIPIHRKHEVVVLDASDGLQECRDAVAVERFADELEAHRYADRLRFFFETGGEEKVAPTIEVK